MLKKNKIFFSKMHGLGNDFVIIESITQQFSLSTKKIYQLSNRNFGIGFDQLLIVESSFNKKIDFNCRIFNSDGSESGQCGNGFRCLSIFLKMKNLTNKKKIYISTKTTKVKLFTTTNSNIVKVNMGIPIFNLRNIISFNKNLKSFKILKKNKFNFNNIVFIGNLHFIIFMHEQKQPKIRLIKKKYRFFLDKFNIGFVQILNREHIFLKVYERGSGFTKSCGSGACAAVSLGILNKKLNKKTIRVDFSSGHLYIKWFGIGHPLYMIGPAKHVYDGFFYL